MKLARLFSWFDPWRPALRNNDSAPFFKYRKHKRTGAVEMDWGKGWVQVHSSHWADYEFLT